VKNKALIRFQPSSFPPIRKPGSHFFPDHALGLVVDPQEIVLGQAKAVADGFLSSWRLDGDFLARANSALSNFPIKY
jgi:hypothetical protein